MLLLKYDWNELGNVIQYPWKSFPTGNISPLYKKSSHFLQILKKENIFVFFERETY